jgi:hypothetical protein
LDHNSNVYRTFTKESGFQGDKVSRRIFGFKEEEVGLLSRAVGCVVVYSG